MFDANGLLGRVLSSGAASGFAGGLLGGGAVGAMRSKKGRKMATSALKVGGIAAVGALAYHAYTRYRSGQAQPAGQPGQSPTPPPVPASPAAATTGTKDAAEFSVPPASSGFVPDASDLGAVQSLSVVLIRAMIAAAKADGEIDADEGRRLFSQMDRQDLSAEERAFLLRELSAPVDLESILAAAETPEIAVEIYAVSLMAIDVSNAAESAYLQLLASRLGLDPALVAEIERTVAAESSDAGASGSSPMSRSASQAGTTP